MRVKNDHCQTCETCDFCDGAGHWKRHDRDIERDCYGCDGSGRVKCEKCMEEMGCKESDTRTE